MKQLKQKRQEEYGSGESLELENHSILDSGSDMSLDLTISTLNHKINGLMDMMDKLLSC